MFQWFFLLQIWVSLTPHQSSQTPPFPRLISSSTLASWQSSSSAFSSTSAGCVGGIPLLDSHPLGTSRWLMEPPRETLYGASPNILSDSYDLLISTVLCIVNSLIYIWLIYFARMPDFIYWLRTHHRHFQFHSQLFSFSNHATSPSQQNWVYLISFFNLLRNPKEGKKHPFYYDPLLQQAGILSGVLPSI